MSAPGDGPPGAAGYAGALLSALVAVAAVAALYLFPYVTRHFAYPTGYDAPAAVARVNEAASRGLMDLGAVRVGASLLLAVLARATSQNGFTAVAVAPAMLAGIAGLAAAGMARAALGVAAPAFALIAVLLWAAFGENSMINIHLDNLLNAALVLAAFGAAVSFLRWGRGLVAAGLLFMGAGLAHWPFLGFALAVYGGAVVAFALAGTGGQRRGRVEVAGRLLAPAAASAAFVGLTFLAPPSNQWLGLRLDESGLRARFAATLRQWFRYVAVPLAAGGVAAAVGVPVPGPRAPGAGAARRFFLCSMAVWIGLTAAAGLAQAAGVPTAGARLINYLFPVTLLAGVLVWRAARWLSAWPAARWAGVALGAVVVAAAVGGFGALTVSRRSNDRPWFEEGLMREAASAGRYVSALPDEDPVVFILGPSTRDRPAFREVRAVLDPEDATRVFAYFGTPAEYLAERPTSSGGSLLDPPPPPDLARATLVLRSLSPAGFRREERTSPDRVIAPGVLVLRGPVPRAPVPSDAPPTADTRLATLVWVTGVWLLILLVAGGGWAAVLLPADPPFRLALAPGLGAAVTTLFALAWDRAGLPFGGATTLLPLALAATAGWASAVVRRRLRHVASKADPPA